MLQMLALADMLNIFFSFMFTAVQENLAYDFMYQLVGNGSSAFTDVIKIVLTPGQSIALTASAWFAVLITVERFLAICHPFRVNSLISLPRVKTAVVAVWIAALLCNVSKFFDNFVEVIPGSMNDIYGTSAAVYHDLRRNTYYIIFYEVIIRSSVNTIIPFALLTFFTTRLVTTLSESSRDKLKLGGDAEEKKKKLSIKQRRTTVTLIIIVINFILLDLPMTLLFVSDVTRRHLRGTSNVLSSTLVLMRMYLSTRRVAYFFTILKSTLNFFIFCLTGKRYRQALHDTCDCSNKRL
jgi:NADH:ubiquinone oxidoreductase subunit 3 (subunit A)